MSLTSGPIHSSVSGYFILFYFLCRLVAVLCRGGRDESNGTNGTVWGGRTTTKLLAQYEVALRPRGRREKNCEKRESSENMIVRAKVLGF